MTFSHIAGYPAEHTTHTSPVSTPTLLKGSTMEGSPATVNTPGYAPPAPPFGVGSRWPVLPLSGCLPFLFSCLLPLQAFSQTDPPKPEKVTLAGHPMYMIMEGKDTLYLAPELDDVNVSSPRRFANEDEKKLYLKYRYYAAKVYPYAVEAIKNYRLIEQAEKEGKTKKREAKKLKKDLSDKYTDELKALPRTAGRILVKMIEKELDKPFYHVVKELRGGFSAFYWNQSAKLFDYQLKHGYVPGEDPILDVVLQDFDVSYRETGK